VSFLLSGGKTTTPAPAQGSLVDLFRINDVDTLLGSAAFPPANPLRFNTLAFLLAKDGTATVLDDGSGFMQPYGMVPYGVDDGGSTAGTYYTGTTTTPLAHGFRIVGGKFSEFGIPHATGTQVLGMNRSGQLTGCFTDTAGSHGFVATP
jgi:hypothetical protein